MTLEITIADAHFQACRGSDNRSSLRGIHPGEDRPELVRHLAHLDVPPALTRNTRHLDPIEPARRDGTERREIAAHVEGEPMHADPLPHADSDGRDLPASHPDTGH